MRRIRILTIVFVCLAAVIVVPGALAGNFDESKMGCTGEDPALCPPATVGQGYSLTIYLSPPDSGRGEDFDCARFNVSSGALPPGLSVSNEGLLAGTPTQAGSYGFYLQVTYDKEPTCTFKNPSEDRFVMNVSPQVLRMFVATNSLPDASINQGYAPPALATSNGNASSWQVVSGTLPPGIQLGSNGAFSGTPTASGVFTFTVQANGSTNNDTKTLSIFVLAPLELQDLTGKKAPTTGLTASSLVNAPLTTGLKAVGGRAPYVFSSSGSLPPGVALDTATGAITGTGTSAGTFRSSLTVTDQTGAKATVPFAITVRPLLAFVRAKVLPAGRVARFYAARIPVSGKDARTALFALAGRIPPGLEYNETTRRLEGTFLKAGTYRLRVYAFSASGAPISKLFTIRVRA